MRAFFISTRNGNGKTSGIIADYLRVFKSLNPLSIPLSISKRRNKSLVKKRAKPSEAIIVALIGERGQIKAAKIKIRGAIIVALIGLLGLAIINADKFYTLAETSSAESARLNSVSLWSRSVGGLFSGLSCLLIMILLLSSSGRDSRNEGENFLAA